MKGKFSNTFIFPKGKYPSPNKVFDQLTSEQQQFLQTKQLDAQRTTTEWLDFFKNLQTFDIINRVRHANLGALVLWITIPLTIANFAWFVRSAEDPLSGVNFFVIFIGLILTWFVTSQISAHMHRKLFPDYFQTVIIPLIATLHEETTEEAPLHLKIDLRQQMDKSAHMISSNAAHQVFDWHVLQVSGELLNAIRMNLSIQIHNQLRLRKHKSKRRVFVLLDLEYSKKKHQQLQLAGTNQQMYKVKHKEKPKKHVLRIRRQLKFKNKFFNFYQYTDIPFTELVALIRNGYQAVSKG
ncbi:hypothetical protein BKI52_18205 [marine bacterium AO1-C]|nr:hypothetical protein BKI52_18205 [marine bacterium AO1-C]